MYCWRLKELCTKLVFWKVYTMMHGQKNIKKYIYLFIFKCFSTFTEWWMLVISLPFLFLPAITMLAFIPKIKYLVAKLTKVSKYLVLLWGTKCCFNCSPEASLFFRITQMNGLFIFITRLLVICILPYPFHPWTMYYVLETPVFYKFKSPENYEGSLELRGMIFLYFPCVWVIVKKASVTSTIIKCFLWFFQCFMCSLSVLYFKIPSLYFNLCEAFLTHL